jgi:hypothetical protein
VFELIEQARLATRAFLEFSGHLFDPTIRPPDFRTPARPYLSPHSFTAFSVGGAFRLLLSSSPSPGAHARLQNVGMNLEERQLLSNGYCFFPASGATNIG